jgi:hypothetical protein
MISACQSVGARGVSFAPVTARRRRPPDIRRDPVSDRRQRDGSCIRSCES